MCGSENAIVFSSGPWPGNGNLPNASKAKTNVIVTDGDIPAAERPSESYSKKMRRNGETFKFARSFTGCDWQTNSKVIRKRSNSLHATPSKRIRRSSDSNQFEGFGINLGGDENGNAHNKCMDHYILADLLKLFWGKHEYVVFAVKPKND